MPAFTTIALDNLLERASSKPLQSVDDSQNVRVSPNHIYITPALYTTPAPTPIPEVSSEYSSSPSPYIVKHKRRGGGSGDQDRTIAGFQIPGVAQKVAEEENEEIQDSILGDGLEIQGFFGEENEFSEYLDPVCASKFETDSVGSVNEGCRSIYGLETHSFASAQSEFFDAKDDFSSDGSFSSYQSRGHSIDTEIRAIRLNILEEVERRETAEDTLKLMQNQWHQISNLLAHVGLTLPAMSIADDDSLEQFIQEVIVTKFVAEAVGKGVARAEAELVSQTILESKEQEISRLRDRLQYYEAVNLEMSQRNQEIVEVTRRQRQKRQRQRKWLWSCIGLSIAVGATVIASSYLPVTGKEQKLPSSGDPVDGSTSSDTA